MSAQCNPYNRKVVEDGNFAQAFWLCAQSFAWLEDMPGLRLAEQLSEETGQRYRETSSLLRVALQAVCADFQPEHYVKVLPLSKQPALALSTVSKMLPCI